MQDLCHATHMHCTSVGEVRVGYVDHQIEDRCDPEVIPEEWQHDWRPSPRNSTRYVHLHTYESDRVRWYFLDLQTGEKCLTGASDQLEPYFFWKKLHQKT